MFMDKNYTYINRCQQCMFYQRGNVYKHPIKNYGGCSKKKEGVSASMTACDKFVGKHKKHFMETGNVFDNQY